MGERLRAGAEFLIAVAVIVALLWIAASVWEPVRVSGLSMSPALSPGDLVIVHKDLRPRMGSIVLVRAAGHSGVLHRVVDIRSDGALTTRGDANAVDDLDKILPHEVAGVVVRVIPVGTALRRWRGGEEVGYHGGSTEQSQTMTETTPDVARSEQRRVRQ